MDSAFQDVQVADDLDVVGAGKVPAHQVGREAAGDDQPDHSGGALGEISRQSREIAGAIFESGMHRPHQHPFAQGGKTKVERG